MRSWLATVCLLAACGGCDDASNLRARHGTSEKPDAIASDEGLPDAAGQSHSANDAGAHATEDAVPPPDTGARSDNPVDADALQGVRGESGDASLPMSPSSPVNKFERSVALDEQTPLGTAQALLDVVIGTYTGSLVNGGDFTGAGSWPPAALGQLRIAITAGDRPSPSLNWTRNLNDHQLTVSAQMAWQATEAGLSAMGPVQIKLGRDVAPGDRLAQVTGSFAFADVQGADKLPEASAGGTVEFRIDWFVNTRIVITMMYHFNARADGGGGNSMARMQRGE